MKKVMLFAMLLSASLTSWAGERIKLSSFNAINVSGNVEVVLVKGLQEYVDYDMVDGDKEKFHAEVKNGTLNVYLDKEYFWFSKAKAKVTVSYRSIDKLNASAGSKVKSESKIKASKLVIESSSGASIKVPVETDRLQSQASSGSHITLTGEAKDVSLQASSGAHLNASDVKAENANAHSSSGGYVGTYVNSQLTAEASSGGSIKYKSDGKCHVDKSTSSGGSVSKM